MTETRKPTAFGIDPSPAKAISTSGQTQPRRPRAVHAESATITPAELDIFDVADDTSSPPSPETRRKRGRIGSFFLGMIGILLSLAVGMWADRLIRDLFARADWLGWLALCVALLAALSFIVIVVRELVGLARLASVEKMRDRALKIVNDNDSRKARALVAELSTFAANRPETAAGRRALKELDDQIIDGGDLLKIAEMELLAPLDAEAQRLILDAAKRVSVVTAISPRALVDLAYVLFEAGRLIRRLAELYGARPGTLGFIRLTRDVLAHLAVTGVMAAGDEFVHQIVGQGLAARLSAKLGEGVVNGMMTARIGVAAMETVRPLPFVVQKRPGMSDFLSALSKFARKQGTTDPRT